MKGKTKTRELTDEYLLPILFCLALFLVLTYAVIRGLTLDFDLTVYSRVMELFSPIATIIFFTFASIGSTYGIIIIALLVALYLIFKKGYRSYASIVFATPIIIYIINEFVKFIVQRPRPDTFRMVPETGYSYPSGHTMQCVALYGIFIMLSSTYIKNKLLKRTINSISTIIILGITIGRIYLGVHYFSDIVGGILLSVIYLMIIKDLYIKEKVE